MTTDDLGSEVIASGEGSANLFSQTVQAAIDLAEVRFKPHAFLCDWNYSVTPGIVAK